MIQIAQPVRGELKTEIPPCHRSPQTPPTFGVRSLAGAASHCEQTAYHTKEKSPPPRSSSSTPFQFPKSARATLPHPDRSPGKAIPPHARSVLPIQSKAIHPTELPLSA